MEIDVSVEYVDLKKINSILEYCYLYRNIFFSLPPAATPYGLNAYIKDGMVTLSVWISKAGKKKCYKFNKDKRKTPQHIDGAEAFRILNMYYKVPRLKIGTDREKDYMAASPFLWKNPDFEGKRVKAWGYDKNSAYSEAMLSPMPDTSKEFRKWDYVKEGEIGFLQIPKNPKNIYEGSKLISKNSGFCEYIFPKISSPFSEFVHTWYEKKQNPETKEKAKEVLNYCIGYLQNINVFLRAAILTAAENNIKSKMDQNSIYVNTDSIVSISERNDFEISNNLGAWKIEKIGKFAFVGYNYQWDNDTPAYRGIPGSWFPKNWDILKNEIPSAGNIYEFNPEKMRVEKCQN